MRSRDRRDPRVVFALIFPVEDFDSWRKVEGLNTWLAEAGVEGMTLYRAVDNSNEVMAILDMRSRSHAEALVSHEELRMWLDRSGVGIYPSVFVGKEIKRFDYRGDLPEDGNPSSTASEDSG